MSLPEIIPAKASMLVVEKLTAIARHEKLYPVADDVTQILKLDESGKTPEETEQAMTRSGSK